MALISLIGHTICPLDLKHPKMTFLDPKNVIFDPKNDIFDPKNDFFWPRNNILDFFVKKCL